MDPDDRVVQSVRSPVVVGPTSTVGPEELSQRGRRIPTTSFLCVYGPSIAAEIAPQFDLKRLAVLSRASPIAAD